MKKSGKPEYPGVVFNPVLINNVRNINECLTGLHARMHYNAILVIKYRSLDDKDTPVIKTIHSLLSKEKREIISKAEVWGRLHYCGFDVLKEIRIGSENVVISQKKGEVSKQKYPSFYPLIRLERIGLEGRIFYEFKIRSMYPYSEFIQEKIFEMNNLDISGKINSDFRVTRCGHILRKYWIDELPQIINWLKGDLKLVGIRAMSRHYLSLFPENFREKYLQIKPGLIPPLLNDSAGGFNSIAETGLRYIESYMKSPLKTDIKYFFSTLFYIFFKGYRSK